MTDETKTEQIEQTQEEQRTLFGKVDVLRNTLEEEMTILTEQIDKTKGQISKLGVKIGSLETRKKNLYAMVKAVKDREIVLNESEPEEDEAFLDTSNHTEPGEESPAESL